MRHAEVVASNAGQRYPSPSEAGTRMTCDPRRSGKAISPMPLARAAVISCSVKYGRRALSGSGNRQQTSHWRHVRLGTSWGSELGGVTNTPTCSSVSTGIEGIRSMCAHPSTFPQGFPGGDQLFTDSPLNTHHNMSHPDIRGTGERSFERAVRLPSHFPSPLYAPKTHVTVLQPRMRGTHSHGYCLCLTWLPPTSNNAATPSVASSAKLGSFPLCPSRL